MSEPSSISMDRETKDALEKLSEHFGLTKSEAIRRLIHMAVEYRFLEPDWQSFLIRDTLKLFKEKELLRIKTETTLFDLREASKEKDRKHDRVMMLIREFLHTMSESERREWFSRSLELGQLAHPEQLPQILPVETSGGYVVNINGKQLFVKELLKDGFPKLDFNQERLIRCPRGFHTKGSWCEACDLIPTCVLVRRERFEEISKES